MKDQDFFWRLIAYLAIFAIGFVLMKRMGRRG
jgi:hypothetical protein